MRVLGTDGFFWHLGLTQGAIGVFALYRMSRRHAKSLQEQGPYAPTTLRTTVVELELAQHSVLDQLESDESSGQ